MEHTQQTLAQLNRLQDLTKIISQYHCSKCASTQLQVRDMSKRISLLQHERSQMILKINAYERQIGSLKAKPNTDKNIILHKSQGQYQPHIKVLLQNSTSSFVAPQQIRKFESPKRTSPSPSRINISPTITKVPIQGNCKIVKEIIQNIKQMNLDNEIDRNYAFMKLSSDFLEHNSKLSVLIQKLNYLIRLREKDRKASKDEKQTIKECENINQTAQVHPMSVSNNANKQKPNKSDGPLKHSPSSVNILEFDSQIS